MCLRGKEVHHQTVQTLVLSLMSSALGEAYQESHRHYPSHQHLLPSPMAQAGNHISYIEILEQSTAFPIQSYSVDVVGLMFSCDAHLESGVCSQNDGHFLCSSVHL